MNLKNKFGHNWNLFGTTTLVVIATAGCASVLFYTNPSLEEYSEFAGGELVDIGIQELCNKDVFPMISSVLLGKCPKLIANQKDALGHITVKFTKRLNFGLCSLYITEFGGSNFLNIFNLPEYRVRTFAVAGQFLSLGVDVTRRRTILSDPK